MRKRYVLRKEWRICHSQEYGQAARQFDYDFDTTHYGQYLATIREGGAIQRHGVRDHQRDSITAIHNIGIRM
jgi:hypothetical protein